MKKTFMLIITTILICTLCLTGCFGGEEKTDSEKLIGTWKSENSEYRMFKFFEDGTCLINTYELEGTYHINEEGHLVINQTNPSAVYIYAYSINYNNDKLTLTDIKNEDYLVFRKQ